MTSNQLDSLLSPTSSQSVSLVNASSIISDNSADLPDSTSSTVEVPSILEQVNRRGTYYVIWNANTKDDFASWWNQSSAAKKIKEPGSKCSQPNWNNVHRTSEWWKKFNQGAARKTEVPCLICKKCNLVLTHPTYSKNGPSGMKKHLESREYGHNATENRATLDISMLLVSYLQDIMVTIFGNNP
jgi:hypothetical protein